MKFTYLQIFILLLGCAFLFHSNRKMTAFLLGTFFSFTIGTINHMLKGVGSDSFFELQNFQISEALFYLTTVDSFFSYFKLNRFINAEIIFLILILLTYFLKRKINLKNYFYPGLFLILTGLILFIYKNTVSFQANSVTFELLQKSFKYEPFSNVSPIKSNLKVFVYIGESTSAMNMSLYGYPRNTTPNLQKISQENLIKYSPVWTNYTLTTSSLLRALSIIKNEDKKKFIPNQNRASIVDVLNNFGIKSYYYSNQGHGGYDNFTSSIIFRNSALKKLSPGETLFGNPDNREKKLFDHEFFSPLINTINSDLNNKPEIYFFHSYAGHGPYEDNIPSEYRTKIDSLYTDDTNYRIFKDPQKNYKENIEAYDSTIKYIDNTLSEIINKLNNFDEPIIFIYFSDHGENVFNNLSHEPSKLTPEMISVPLLIYFNKSAKKNYEDKFLHLKKQSKKNNLSLLSQLPRLFLDLFNIEGKEISKIYEIPPEIGSYIQDKYFIIHDRETNQGREYIDITSPPFKENYNGTNSMAGFLISYNKNYNNKVCMHASNNFESIFRGLISGNCLEFDLVIEGDKMNVYHPPKKTDNPLTIENLINETTKKTNFWIDGKNINEVENCYVLHKFIEKNKFNFKNILVEFPHNTNFKNTNLSSCAKKISEISNVKIDYYIDTDTGKRCLFDSNKNACQDIRKKIEEISLIPFIKNISFDKNLWPIIEKNNDIIKKFTLNSWSYSAKEITPDLLRKLDYVIYANPIRDNKKLQTMEE